MFKAIGSILKWTLMTTAFVLLIPLLILRELVKMGDYKKYSITSTI